MFAFARCSAFLAAAVVAVSFHCGAQTPAKSDDQDQAQATPAPENETPQQKLDRAWQMLTSSATDAKHGQTRIQALAALSTLGNNPRADKLIAHAMRDPDLDVRTAAVLAAGKSKAPALADPARKLLNDPEPEVVFATATTLWTDFKDHSGEDILAAVASGGRKATPGLMHGAEHDMTRTMHNPSELARIGATESAGLLLGPFGFSIAALEYMRKNGSDSARVKSIELLAQEKTPAVRQEMVEALGDKDPGVRAAAAKSIGDFHLRNYATAVGPLLDDPKQPVRLTAAAAYINCMSAPASARTHP